MGRTAGYGYTGKQYRGCIAESEAFRTDSPECISTCENAETERC